MKPHVHYILNDQGIPVPEPSLLKWALWLNDFELRRVGDDTIEGYRVSTVFLGIDHNWSAEGPPILWESMVLKEDAPMDQRMDRCSGSREQAEAMHKAMLERVEAVVLLAVD